MWKQLYKKYLGMINIIQDLESQLSMYMELLMPNGTISSYPQYIKGSHTIIQNQNNWCRSIGSLRQLSWGLSSSKLTHLQQDKRFRI